jgi:hypothetical protein
MASRRAGADSSDLARVVQLAPGATALGAPRTSPAASQLPMLLLHDTTELDALILVGSDPASAERCLGALVAVSHDVPLRTWVIELRQDLAGPTPLQQRCVWTRGVEALGSVSSRINRALTQGGAPLVLILDGSHAIDADTVRALIKHLRSAPELGAAGLGALERSTHSVRAGSVGPALLLRREALERVGALYDENHFCGAQAEAEAWCRRAELAGVVVQLTASQPSVARPAQCAPRLVLKRAFAPMAHEDCAARDPLMAPRSLHARANEAGTRAVDALGEALIARANRALGGRPSAALVPQLPPSPGVRAIRSTAAAPVPLAPKLVAARPEPRLFTG